jgi:hypothetical protein
MEEALRTPRNEAISIPDRLTVEHLLPQSADPLVYPYATDPPLQIGETRELRRQSLMHTIGNLTLLTGPLNSSISNGAFRDKSKAIGYESDLRLNADFRGAPVGSWSEADILSLGAARFKLAISIWPHPARVVTDQLAVSAQAA